jgi:hypothetical protein
MVRRLALGSPYSKPSTTTAEDGLPHTAHSLSFAGQYFASIAAVHISMQCGQAMPMRCDDQTLHRATRTATFSV